MVLAASSALMRQQLAWNPDLLTDLPRRLTKHALCSGEEEEGAYEHVHYTFNGVPPRSEVHGPA